MELISSCKEKLFHFRIKELKDVLTQLSLSKQGKKQVELDGTLVVLPLYYLISVNKDLVDRILAILSDEQVSRTLAKKNDVRKEDVVKLVEDTYRYMLVSRAPDIASKGSSVSETSSAKTHKGRIDDPLQSDSKTRCPCGSSLLTGSMIKCDDPECLVLQHTGCVIISEKTMERDPPHPERFYCEICRLSRADPFLVSVAHPLYPMKLSPTIIPTDGTNPAQSVEKTFQLTRADQDLLTKPEYDVQAWCMLLNDKVSFRMQWPQYADLQVNGILVRAINRPGAQLLGLNGRDDGPIITPWTKDGLNKILLAGCDARIFCMGVRIVKRRSIQQILDLIPNESVGESFQDALARVRRCINGGVSNDAESDSDVEVVAGSFGVNLRCPMSGSRMKVAGRFKPCIHMGCFDLEVFVEMNQRSRKWQCPICLNNYTLQNVIIDPYFNRITTMMHHCSEDVTEVELKSDGSWRAKTKSEIERRNLGDLGQWHGPDGSFCVPTSGQTPKIEVIQQVKEECVTEDHPSLKLGIKKNSNGFWEVSKPEEKAESFEQKVISMSSSDGEDPNIKQDTIGLDSISLSPAAAQENPEIVVLSDSEEDDVPLIYNHSVNNTCGVNPPGFSVSYASDPNLGPGDTSGLGLFNANDDECVMPTWPLSNANHNPPDGLVDNPLAFGAVDPSLQIFLPTMPSDASEPSDLGDQADVSNFVRTEDWISFRLGARASVNRFNSRYHAPSNEEAALDSLADTASLLYGMNDSESARTRQRPDSPFPDHQQQRSVRPRLYLSVDSDSE